MQLAAMQPGDIPVPAYLVQTDDGKNILIDTGFPAHFAENQIELSGGTTVEMRAENFVVNRLEAIGVRPTDVNTVICSHFDADHAGAHRMFLNAEFVVQQTHYEHARQSEHPRFVALRDEWNEPSLRYRFVEGDAESVPGVELIETSGHVPGHQAVLVRLPETGAVILAIDAIPHSSMLDADTRWVMPIDMNEAETRASTRKLVELAKRENVRLIIHGHDAGQWKTLRHAPEFYS